MEKGLKRLLRDYNYTFIYDDSEKYKDSECKIRKIIILSMAKGSRGRVVEPVIISPEELSSFEFLNEGLLDEDLLNEDLLNEYLDKLEEIESESLVDSLIGKQKVEDAEIRLMIVEEIAKKGGDKAIQALENALEDEDEGVKNMAADKLQE